MAKFLNLSWLRRSLKSKAGGFSPRFSGSSLQVVFWNYYHLSVAIKLNWHQKGGKWETRVFMIFCLLYILLRVKSTRNFHYKYPIVSSVPPPRFPVFLLEKLASPSNHLYEWESSRLKSLDGLDKYLYRKVISNCCFRRGISECSLGIGVGDRVKCENINIRWDGSLGWKITAAEALRRFFSSCRVCIYIIANIWIIDNIVSHLF